MRSNAFNYLEPAWSTNNSSILQKRTSIFLGLKNLQTRSLTDAFDVKHLELITNEQFAQSPRGRAGTALDDLGDIDLQEAPVEESTGGKEDRLFNEITFLKDGSLSGSFLRSGIQADNYLVRSARGGDAFHLIFRPDQQELGWDLASYNTREEAITSANDLRRLFIRLNVESEGLHLVEHILLRPLDLVPHRDVELPEDFYAFTVSVFFPGWTARFHDAMFRRLAEETVQLNCPAHIYPECHWLDFQKMREFERLYQRWLDIWGSDRSCPPDIDAASTPLISFILEIRADGSD